MNNKIKSLLAILSIGLLFSSCATIKVNSDVDASVDFSKYKTFQYYGWTKDSDKQLNDLDKRRLEQAFRKEFEKRGLTLVESGGDLVVSLFILVKQKVEQEATTTYNGGGYYGGYYGYGPRWGWGPGYSSTRVSEYEYQEGTLVVDVFDAAEKRLIWESIGVGTIDENPSNREKNIPKAVEKIMEDYPVKPIGE